MVEVDDIEWRSLVCESLERILCRPLAASGVFDARIIQAL
jgi:hypothetical protein